MRIVMTGASGFVGRPLADALRADGQEVVRLVRRAPERPDEVSWDPTGGALDPGALGAVDAAIHLAGENIAGGRWNETRKRRIRDSRVLGTRTLVTALTALEPRPRVLLSASAMGFFGVRGDELLDEGAAMGEGFLAETCRDWEAETRPAVEAGVRVCQMRIGLVLGRDGGALKAMLLPFRLGLGGRLGAGDQWMSWIALDDAIGAFRHALTDGRMCGPVHVVAPTPVTNAAFTRALGRALRRPTVVPVPAFAVRLLLGREMADALLLGGARLTPKRLLDAGYAFRHPEIDDALQTALRR